MKIRVTMKTPDAVDNALQVAFGFVDEEDRDEYYKAKAILDKFFKYRETCVIEIDTESETAEVLKIGA